MRRRPLYPVVTVLLLLALTISAMPVRAFAENEAQGEEVAVEFGSETQDLEGAFADDPQAAEIAEAVVEAGGAEEAVLPASEDEPASQEAPAPETLEPVTINEDDLVSGEAAPIRYDAPSASTAANYEANARGFYAWLGDDYANAVFESTLVSTRDGKRFTAYTNMGAKDDATSLDNMRMALSWIPRGNELRVGDDLFPGLAALKISSKAMAVAQVNANWSAVFGGHSSNYGNALIYLENLAYSTWYDGYDPYDGWYLREKQAYIAQQEFNSSTGHYLTIVDQNSGRSHDGTGYAINTNGTRDSGIGKPYKYVSCQTFKWVGHSDRLWDYDEYLSLFNTFCDAHDISKATVTFATQTYDGTAKTPAPTVKLGSKTLVNGTDYTLSNYKNNVNAGTASVTITAKGSNFFGSKTVTFTINARPISDAGASVSSGTYNGSAIKPKPHLTIDGQVLVEGTDYTITSYANNVNAGTATVTVTGKGNYRDTATYQFTINPASISGASVTAAGQTYDGTAKKPAPTVKVGNRTLVSGTDFTVTSYSGNVNAGTATVKVTGKGNYTGTASGTFKISPADLSKAKVTVANQTYDGSAKKPAPTVAEGGKTLAAGTDYTVSYTGNVNAGTATVTVTGKGNYAGTKKATFEISPASLSTATVTAASQTYTGSARQPAPTVTLDGKTLSATDYTVAYSDNVNAGTAAVTVTGKGNYKDSASGTFAINKRAISSATIEPIADQPYVGSAVKPKPSLSYGGKALKEGTDYSLAYKDNAGVGTATITITGKGNFKGTTTVTFQIVKADLSKATVTAKDQAYDGTAKRTTLTVKFGGLTLKEGTDFTVAYKDNVNAGTATVTLTGKGNFTGTKKATFKINAASLAKASVAAKDQTYTGSALQPAPTVTLGGKTLAAADYSVSYKDNLNVGTATVTVTGKGNYIGAASGTFAIKRASIAKAVVIAPDQEWTGKPIAPAPTVTLAGRKLTVGKNGDCKVIGYANNVDEGTATVTVQGQGNYTGTASGTFEIVNAVPVYRLYNHKTSEHLYTINKGEYDQLPVITKGDWIQEGIAWYAPKTSKTPVYRLYNKKSGDHHYTTSPGERDALVANHGWSSEGIAFYSDDAKRLPLYRVYNHRLQRGQHHYTASIQERDALTSKHGWKDEGIGFYGVRAK